MARPSRKNGHQGIYRSVSVRMWTDEKFCTLSPLPPSGQSLWLYLLTGPSTCVIPGVVLIGKGGLSEALGWSLADVDRCAREVFGEDFPKDFTEGIGFASWKNRVLWLPNGVKHNFPTSPNVAFSWGKYIPMIPPCELRDKIVSDIRKSLLAMESGSWCEAFDRGVEITIGRPLGKPSPKVAGKASTNQEQEQEQEQEEEGECLRRDGADERAAAAGPENTPATATKKTAPQEFPFPADIADVEARVLKHWNEAAAEVASNHPGGRRWVRHTSVPSGAKKCLVARLKEAGSIKAFGEHFFSALAGVTSDPWWTSEAKNGWRPNLLTFFRPEAWGVRVDQGRDDEPEQPLVFPKLEGAVEYQPPTNGVA